MAITCLKFSTLPLLHRRNLTTRALQEKPEEVAGILVVDSPVAIRIARFSDLDDMPAPGTNSTGLIVYVKVAQDGQATFDYSAHKIRLHHLSRDDTKDHRINHR